MCTESVVKICPITGLKMSTVGGGRAAVYIPEHPKANNRGYVLRSRYLIEKKIKSRLESKCHVHHINEKPSDDDINNLEVLTISEHTKLHNPSIKRKRRLDYGAIKILMKKGLGYRKISKILKEPLYSIKYACKVIKKGRNFGFDGVDEL